MGIRLQHWSLFELALEAGSEARYWLIRAERPGAPVAYQPACDLADDLLDLRTEAILRSALALERLAGARSRVRPIGRACPVVRPTGADRDHSALLELHGRPRVGIWLARPPGLPDSLGTQVSLWTAPDEAAFWSWAAETEWDHTFKHLARPATAHTVRLWTEWDFRMYEHDALWVPEVDWLGAEGYRALTQGGREHLSGPRSACLDLSADAHRNVWLARFDRLTELRRAEGDVRHLAFDLGLLAPVAPEAALARLDALLPAFLALKLDAEATTALAIAVAKAGPSPERAARLRAWAASTEPGLRELAAEVRRLE